MTDQVNVHFGKSKRDQIARRAIQRLRNKGLEPKEVLKEMLVQLEQGLLDIDPDTLTFTSQNPHTTAEMFSRLLEMMQNGAVMITSQPGQPDTGATGLPGQSRIQVSQEVMEAFGDMED